MGDDEVGELEALYAPLRHLAGIIAPAGTAPDDLVQEMFTRVIERGDLAGIESPIHYFRRALVNLVKLAFGSNVDATAFTGDGLVAMVHDSSTSRALVWDLTTGHRAELAAPPESVLVSVWTGREMIALAIPNGKGDAIGWRLGP
jgi:hypothetical protein